MDGELSEVAWLVVELAPGDAVFLPTGWWHQVVALEASISVSRGAFRWPSNRTWYAPGRFNQPDGEE
jgi:ribosomal protein L16 Arg81 hydroxylase